MVWHRAGLTGRRKDYRLEAGKFGCDESPEECGARPLASHVRNRANARPCVPMSRDVARISARATKPLKTDRLRGRGLRPGGSSHTGWPSSSSWSAQRAITRRQESEIIAEPDRSRSRCRSG